MSTRAYKLLEVRTEQDPTFTFHDDEIMAIAIESENNAIISFGETMVKEEIDNLNEKENRTDRENEVLNIFKEILEDMGDDDYVEYYCF